MSTSSVYLYTFAQSNGKSNERLKYSFHYEIDYSVDQRLYFQYSHKKLLMDYICHVGINLEKELIGFNTQLSTRQFTE